MRSGATSRGKTLLWLASLSLVPLAFLLLEVAFRYPEQTERLYGERLYPQIVRLLGELNGLVPFSLAQGVCAALLIVGAIYLLFRKRKTRARSKTATLVKAVAILWVLAGVAGLWFLISWGLNYARPGLAKRMELSTQEIESEEVLVAGERCAELATELHTSLGQAADKPTRLPVDFQRLNEILDRRLQELRLPGDSTEPPMSPAKKLWGSTALSYLGLSGIFVAFTGEPSINAMVPDATLPIVVAHERAHQRGITNEGEANLVAFMACSGTSEQPYLPYAAYLYAAAELLQAASLELPEETGSAWAALGPGPRRDLEAIREFWSRYHGPAAEAADRINDVYLRSFRVPEGVHSYQRVVELLVALDRQGKL